MPRQASGRRREELEEALLEYVLEHGIGDLSLRPLAEALGTSTYSLVYHFGSKDAVVAAALRAINRHLVRLFEEWAKSSSPGDLLRRYWRWTSSDRNRAYLRLYFEVYGLSLHDRNRFPGFLDSDGLDSWVATVRTLLAGQAGIPEDHAERLATMLMTIVAGMQLDLLTSGDRARTTAALEEAASLLDDYAARIKQEAATPAG